MTSCESKDKHSKGKQMEKGIKVCPVCHSDNIIQKMGYGFGDMLFGDGSYCGNCGVQFNFNSIHVKQELNKMATAIKQARKVS